MKIEVKYKDNTKKVYEHFDIDKFENIEEITKIECYYQKLKSLPQSIGNFEYLFQLNCSGNELKSLPKGIIKLKYLEDFNCEYELLDTLPDKIRKLIEEKFF